MTNAVPDWNRVIEAGLFHGRLLRDQPYSCGPFPEPVMAHLAEAAAQMVNVTPILTADASDATKKEALELALAAMWAAGFKTAAQAMGPTRRRHLMTTDHTGEEQQATPAGATPYIPAAGEFVFVLRQGYIDFPGQVTAVNTETERALVRLVGQDIDPISVSFDDIRQHPLSTQRNRPEEAAP